MLFFAILNFRLSTSLSEPDAFPLGVRNFLYWSRVENLRMLGGGVTSLSDSLVVEGLVRSLDSSSVFDLVEEYRCNVNSFSFFCALCLGDGSKLRIPTVSVVLFWFLPVGEGLIICSQSLLLGRARFPIDPQSRNHKLLAVKSAHLVPHCELTRYILVLELAD